VKQGYTGTVKQNKTTNNEKQDEQMLYNTAGYHYIGDTQVSHVIEYLCETFKPLNTQLKMTQSNSLFNSV